MILKNHPLIGMPVLFNLVPNLHLRNMNHGYRKGVVQYIETEGRGEAKRPFRYRIYTYDLEGYILDRFYIYPTELQFPGQVEVGVLLPDGTIQKMSEFYAANPL